MNFEPAEEIKDNDWKLLGTYTGSDAATLPSKYREIMLVIWNGRGTNHTYDNWVQIIPREVLISTNKQFLFTSTITSQSFNAYVSYQINLTSLYAANSVYGSQSYLSNLETVVYYR